VAKSAEGTDNGQPQAGLQLSIPLAPIAGIGTLIRDRLIRLRGPHFFEAYRATLWWLPPLLVLGVTGRGLVHETLGVALLVCSVVIAVYVIFRVFVLERLEHSQREFEPKWLAAQSEVLRSQYFEILRFTVYGRRFPRRNSGAPHRLFDLQELHSADELLRTYSAERQNGSRSWVLIDVAVGPGPEGEYEVQSVRRPLTDLELIPSRTGLESGRARFPAAQYVASPASVRRAARWPSSSTYAVLSDPMRIYVGPAPAPGRAAVGRAAPGRVAETGAP